MPRSDSSSSRRYVDAFDLGSCANWENHFPLGITVPRAAEVIQAWLNHEHASVLLEIANSLADGDAAHVLAKPPTAQRPWSFVYRTLGGSSSASRVAEEFFTTDPATQYFGPIWDELNASEGDRRPSRVGLAGPVSERPQGGSEGAEGRACQGDPHESAEDPPVEPYPIDDSS